MNHGARLSCTWCKRKGATVGCLVDSCRSVVHYPCAKQEEVNCGRPLTCLWSGLSFYYCAQHAAELLNVGKGHPTGPAVVAPAGIAFGQTPAPPAMRTGQETRPDSSVASAAAAGTNRRVSVASTGESKVRRPPKKKSRRGDSTSRASSVLAGSVATTGRSDSESLSANHGVSDDGHAGGGDDDDDDDGEGESEDGDSGDDMSSLPAGPLSKAVVLGRMLSEEDRNRKKRGRPNKSSRKAAAAAAAATGDDAPRFSRVGPGVGVGAGGAASLRIKGDGAPTAASSAAASHGGHPPPRPPPHARPPAPAAVMPRPTDDGSDESESTPLDFYPKLKQFLSSAKDPLVMAERAAIAVLIEHVMDESGSKVRGDNAMLKVVKERVAAAISAERAQMQAKLDEIRAGPKSADASELASNERLLAEAVEQRTKLQVKRLELSRALAELDKELTSLDKQISSLTERKREKQAAAAAAAPDAAEDGALFPATAEGMESALRSLVCVEGDMESFDKDHNFSRGTLVVTDPACLKHLSLRTGKILSSHPEQPKRLQAVLKAVSQLRETDSYPSLRLMDQLPDPDVDVVPLLALAHSQDYVSRVAALVSSAGKGKLAVPMPEETDTILDSDSWRAARAAVLLAVEGTRAVLRGDCANAFCAVRPPGHHAGRAGVTFNVETHGFCVFNNVAIAAIWARVHGGLDRVAVIDFDVHHGNGTEEILTGDPGFHFSSLHSFGDTDGDAMIYPGTGATGAVTTAVTSLPSTSELAKASNVINFAFPRTYTRSALAAPLTTICASLRQFAPQLIIISAGFDAHIDDPMKLGTLTAEDFHWMTGVIVNLAEEVCGGKIVSVLEGGYGPGMNACAEAHCLALLREPMRR